MRGNNLDVQSSTVATSSASLDPPEVGLCEYAKAMHAIRVVLAWRCSRAASRLVTSRLRSSLSSFDAGDSSEATASNISHKTSS